MDFTINFAAINVTTVFIAAVAAMLIGALWFSPFVLGNVWRKANNMGPGEPMKDPARIFAISFVLHIIAASLLASLLGPNSTGVEGIQLGTLLGFGFVTTAIGITNLFEQRPLILVVIHAFYHMLSYGLMGFILGTWG